jgi:hypothetical protein
MSCGLGNVQRKIIEVLQARDGSCALHELVFLVYAPFDPARDRDISTYKLMYCDLYKRDRVAYVATWRAVQTLKRRGIVTTVVVHLKPELAPLLPPAERQWIRVEFAEKLCLPDTTLMVTNDGWSDPRRLRLHKIGVPGPSSRAIDRFSTSQSRVPKWSWRSGRARQEVSPILCMFRHCQAERLRAWISALRASAPTRSGLFLSSSCLRHILHSNNNRRNKC